MDRMPRMNDGTCVSAFVCETKDKFQTTHFLLSFFSRPPVCLCVIITQQPRRLWVIHRAASCIMLRDCIQLQTGTVPLYLPGGLSALSHAGCLLGSQTEHSEENCLGKRSDTFSCAANLVQRLITAAVSVKHLGLLKAYKRYSIWGRVACDYQKKTFSFDTPSCLILCYQW